MIVVIKSTSVFFCLLHIQYVIYSPQVTIKMSAVRNEFHRPSLCLKQHCANLI